jgi:hypothetical protein
MDTTIALIITMLIKIADVLLSKEADLSFVDSKQNCIIIVKIRINVNTK